MHKHTGAETQTCTCCWGKGREEGRCEGDVKGGQTKLAVPHKRWRKKEEDHEEKKGSNGCEEPRPPFHFLSSSRVPKMAPLNHKMLRRSPLTLPRVWTQIGWRQFDTDSRPHRLLWSSGYQLLLPSASIPHARWRHTKGAKERMAFEILRKYSGTKRLLMKSIAEFKRDWKRLNYFISKTFFFVLCLWCKSLTWW